MEVKIMLQYVDKYSAGEYPFGITLDNQDNVYIVEYNSHILTKYDSNKQKLAEFGTRGIIKTDNYGLQKPRAVAVDLIGNVYVADTYNHRVIKLNSNLEYVSQFGITNQGKNDNTGLLHPSGVTVDSIGNVYVADYNNHRLVKLNSNMQYVSQFGITLLAESDTSGLTLPGGLSIDIHDNIYVTDGTTANRIMKINSITMNYISHVNVSVTTNYTTSGSDILTVAVDKKGFIYTADPTNYVVCKFDSNLQYIEEFKSDSVKGIYLKKVSGIAIDSEGYVNVADYNNCEIFRLGRVKSFIKFSPIEIEKRKIIQDELIAKQGQVIFCPDSKQMYVDGREGRFKVSDIEFLQTERDLDFVNTNDYNADGKFYFIKQNGSVYIYSDGWNKLISNDAVKKLAVLYLGTNRLKLGYQPMVIAPGENMIIDSIWAIADIPGSTKQTKLQLSIGNMNDTGEILWEDPINFQDSTIIFEPNAYLSTVAQGLNYNINSTSLIKIVVLDTDINIKGITININLLTIPEYNITYAPTPS